MWKVFVSYHKEDEPFYDQLGRFSMGTEDFTITRYDLQLHFKSKATRLFCTDQVIDALNYPNLAVVILSPNYLRNAWLQEELRALYAVEQKQKKDFILPLLIGDIQDSDIPLYFLERKYLWVDFRGVKDEIQKESKMKEMAKLVGECAKPKGKVFIGHGRSSDWFALRDLLQGELRLEYDEFNRTSPQGMATKDRLEEMLNGASFAFLVMTAEDSHKDDTVHARENVIHEAGLFQGRLGFERAVMLLEEGCNQFSNVAGLTYMTFKRGNIDGCFEKIRGVLKREGIIG